MSLVITNDFEAEKELPGHSPVFLVELNGLARFYGTREPGFTGKWLSGDGVIATVDPTNAILCNDDQPTYETIIHKITNQGIGTVTFELDEQGFARTGDSSVSLINAGGLNLELEDQILENAVCRILLGFNGLPRRDYIVIFKGAISHSSVNFERLNLRLADDTMRNITPVPAQIGNDFRPRAFDQGKAFPILLGDVEDVPMIQLVGDAATTLGQQLLASHDELIYFNPTTRFPREGTVRVQDSTANYTVTYDGLTTTVINSQVYGVLLNISTPGATAEVGATVTLETPEREYLLGFAGHNIRRVRTNTGGVPDSAHTFAGNEPIDFDGGDPRKISMVKFPTAAPDSESLQASIAGAARGLNLVVNGNFTTNVTTGWTVGNGAFDWHLPASTFDRVGRVRTLVSQTLQTDVRQDITVRTDVRHRLTFTARNVDLAFMALQVGTTTDATKYYEFSELTQTSENLFDLIFQPDEATLRITLIGDNGGSSGSEKTGYFDQIDLYEVTSENPAVQIKHLIDTHMKNIDVDEVSFDEAKTIWDNSRDRCAGIIQQTEEQQALLGRLAQQFRARTWFDEDGKQKIRVFDANRQVDRFMTKADVLKGSMTVERTPIEDVYTHYYVYYGRIPEQPVAEKALGGRQTFSGVAVATPQETSHPNVELKLLCESALNTFRQEKTLEVFADMVPDAQTACNLLDYLVRRGTHQRIKIKFTTWLRAVDLEVTDFIDLSHPLINGSKVFEITKKDITPNGCEVRIEAEEIQNLLFGAFEETWEPLRLRVKERIHKEGWEPAPPPTPAAPTEFFGSIPNPHTEPWDADNVSADLFNTQTWVDGDPLYSGLIGSATFFPFMPLFNGIPTAWHGIDQETFSPSRSGIQMNPYVRDRIHTTLASTPSSSRSTGLRAKRYCIDNDVNYPIIIRDDLGAERDSIQLRKGFSEFLWMLTGSVNNQPNNNGHVLELGGGDQPNQSPATFINTNKDFTLRIFVKLTDKNQHYPIWTTFSETTNEVEHPFGIWYNATSDRFMFAVGNDVPGVTFAGGAGNNLNANVASMTQKVEANTFGSPSAGTWYQIMCTWDVSTTTAGIQINGGTLDTAVITPDFTGYIVDPGLIGGGPYTIDGYPPHRFTSDGILGAQRVTLNGSISSWALWQKLLTAANGTTLYGAGTPVRFDTLP
jgi:hypothetical protein